MVEPADDEQPGSRPPAPPPLDIVQAFVNSRDREAGTEALGSPGELAAWLRRHDLIGGEDPVAPRDVRDAIELREAIRGLLLEHNGETPSAETRAAFARHAERSPLAARLEDEERIVLAPAHAGVQGAWASLLGAIAQSSAQGTWPRLKACRSDTCQWAFYDHSKNRSSHWCTMEICGARDKMRRYRRRTRG